MLTWTCPVEMNRPTANSSESPGRIGNSSPHSMKTIRALNQKNCDPKVDSRYWGSIHWGPSECITG